MNGTDAIAELGLDASGFNREIDSAIKKLSLLTAGAIDVNKSLATMAITVGIALATAIYKSRQESERLNSILIDLKKNDPFGEMAISAGKLEGRIKTINEEIAKMDNEGVGEALFRTFVTEPFGQGSKGMSPEEREAARDRQRQELREQEAAYIARITAKQAELTQILYLQLKGEKEQADLLRVHLEYREKIARAVEAGNGPLAAQLKTEEKITQELVKQAALKKEQEAEAAEGDANYDAAKKGSDENFKRIEEQKREQADEKAEGDANYQQAAADRNKARVDEMSAIQADEAAEGDANYQQARSDRQKSIADAERRRQLSNELTVMDLSRRGNKTAARKEDRAQYYDDKIRDAIRRGDRGEEELLRKEANAEQAKFDVEESNKTAADRREERAAGRTTDRDEAQAKAQNKDLDDRLERGARGDKNSRLEQRREENDRTKQRQAQQEKIRDAKEDEGGAGYGKTDRGYLLDIRNALQPKD